jgi:hypothetical protein
MKREQITNAHLSCIAMLLYRRGKTVTYIYTPFLLPCQRKVLYNAYAQIKNHELNRGFESSEETWCEAYCILTALHNMQVHVKSLCSTDLREWM